MKDLSTSGLLLLLIRTVRETNKDFFMCQPTVPTWTDAFVAKLERRLKKAKTKEVSEGRTRDRLPRSLR